MFGPFNFSDIDWPRGFSRSGLFSESVEEGNRSNIFLISVRISFIKSLRLVFKAERLKVTFPIQVPIPISAVTTAMIAVTTAMIAAGELTNHSMMGDHLLKGII